MVKVMEKLGAMLLLGVTGVVIVCLAFGIVFPAGPELLYATRAHGLCKHHISYHVIAIFHVDWGPTVCLRMDGEARALTWLPNGTVSFILKEPHDKMIVLMDADGAVQKSIPSQDLSGFYADVCDLAGSPLSPVFAVTICDMSGGSTIAVFDQNWRMVHQTIGFEPVFSPDGKRIAFMLSAGRQDANGIAILEISSGNITQIVKQDNISTISWSPDGKFLAYQSYDYVHMGSASYVFVVNTSGKIVPKKLGGPFNWGPTWSPDSTRVAYINANQRQIISVIATNIYTNESRILAWNVGLPNELVWSPDGHWLAAGLPGSFVGVNVDDGTILHIGNDSGYEPPLWRPV